MQNRIITLSSEELINAAHNLLFLKQTNVRSLDDAQIKQIETIAEKIYHADIFPNASTTEVIAYNFLCKKLGIYYGFREVDISKAIDFLRQHTMYQQWQKNPIFTKQHREAAKIGCYILYLVSKQPAPFFLEWGKKSSISLKDTLTFFVTGYEELQTQYIGDEGLRGVEIEKALLLLALGKVKIASIAHFSFANPEPILEIEQLLGNAKTIFAKYVNFFWMLNFHLIECIRNQIEIANKKTDYQLAFKLQTEIHDCFKKTNEHKITMPDLTLSARLGNFPSPWSIYSTHSLVTVELNHHHSGLIKPEIKIRKNEEKDNDNENDIDSVAQLSFAVSLIKDGNNKEEGYETLKTLKKYWDEKKENTSSDRENFYQTYGDLLLNEYALDPKKQFIIDANAIFNKLQKLLLKAQAIAEEKNSHMNVQLDSNSKMTPQLMPLEKKLENVNATLDKITELRNKSEFYKASPISNMVSTLKDKTSTSASTASNLSSASSMSSLYNHSPAQTERSIKESIREKEKQNKRCTA